MAQTKISQKYQVVIPKAVRQRLKLKEGQRLWVWSAGEAVVMAPRKRWPNDYLKDLAPVFKGVDVIKYLEEERASWD